MNSGGTDQGSGKIARWNAWQGGGWIGRLPGADVHRLILKNPNVSTVITGASRIEQVKENMKAMDVVEN